MKDLIELFKFLDKELRRFTIETLIVNVSGEESLEFEDLKKIREFCDDLTVTTNQNGKLSLVLLFLPKKDGAKE